MNVNITGAVSYRSYGLVTINFLKSLVKLNHKVALWPLPSIHHVEADPADHDLIRECVSNQNMYDYGAPSLRIWHQFDLAQHAGRGKRVGYTIFELDRLKPNERHHLLAQDLILVPSEWAKNIVRQEDIHIPIKTVPLGYDPEIFNPNISNYDIYTPQLSPSFAYIPPPGPTRFFNAGKWELRKGHDVLVEIFNKAFEKTDNVELHLMPHNPFLKDYQVKEWEQLYKNSKLGNKITIHPWFPSQKQVAGMMRKMDVGIFPSRAEGWNLEALEMAACGKPVIITNYSAHREFVWEEVSNNMSIPRQGFYLVHADELEDAYDGIWFNGEGKWASIGDNEIDQFVDKIRNCHRLKQEDKLPCPNVSEFTWERSAGKLIEAMND